MPVVIARRQHTLVRPRLPLAFTDGRAFRLPWDSPQANGLVTWIVAQGQTDVYEVLTGSTVTSGGTIASTVPAFDESAGQGCTFDGSDDTIQLSANAAARVNPATAGLTMTCWYLGGATHPVGGHLYQSVGASANYRGAWLSAASMFYGDNTGAGSSDYRSVIDDDYLSRLKSQQLNFVAGRIYPGTHPYTMDVWSNGSVAVNMTTSGTGGDISYGTSVNQAVGYRELATNLYYNQTVFDIRVYNRIVSNAELYEMFVPAQRWALYARSSRRGYAFFNTVTAAGGVPKQMDNILRSTWA